jgi:hypothetical protein
MNNHFYKRLFQVLLCTCFFPILSFAQDTLNKKPMVPVQQHAGFDVIILKNGELVYGLVKEVGLVEIRYQRTDIPDGPVYVILRSDVYAISYRNQVKDIINPPGTTVFTQTVMDTVKIIPLEIIRPDTTWDSGFSDTTWNVDFPMVVNKQKTVFVGLGIIRGFTKVDNADDYSSSAGFPTINLGYEVYKKNKLRVGIQASIGSNKFSRQEFSSYDSAQKNYDLKENIFTLNLYGKYNLTNSYSSLKPYLLAGIGIRSSTVHSELLFNFINSSNQTILVKSGGRAVGIGTMFRVGADYRLNDSIHLYADAGTGPSVIQLGVGFGINNFK